MGYKMPIVCKEIYIPCLKEDDASMTLDEYKDKYGLDLKQFIVLYGSAIYFEFPLYAKVYLVSLERWADISNVSMINNITSQEWIEGDDDGFTSFMFTDIDKEHGFGIRLGIAKDEEFLIDNIVITPAVI